MCPLWEPNWNFIQSKVASPGYPNNYLHFPLFPKPPLSVNANLYYGGIGKNKITFGNLLKKVLAKGLAGLFLFFGATFIILVTLKSFFSHPWVWNFNLVLQKFRPNKKSLGEFFLCKNQKFSPPILKTKIAGTPKRIFFFFLVYLGGRMRLLKIPKSRKGRAQKTGL